MQIVFAHYHLNPGGVTQVILSQIAALAALPAEQRPARIAVLYGARKGGWPDQLPPDSASLDVQLISVPELDYDEGWQPQSESLAELVQAALNSHGFTADETLLHVHNHALGKNISWPGALATLSRAGYRLLLQIHDFAEDFRPANFSRLAAALTGNDPGQLARTLYPQASHIHYATLTEKDAMVLRQAGIAAERTSVLSNPATEFSDLPARDEVSARVRTQLGIPEYAQLVVYPVRGIRRKNVGEMLLHAAISPENTWHAITLAPRNPAERASFEHWRALAKQAGLRVLFDICGSGKPAFLDTLAASDRLITTSVAEGFGMVFLEAWLVGKQLVGRRIPQITDEFEEAGLRFDRLRETLNVPLTWISDRKLLAAALQESYTLACNSYGVSPDALELQRAWQLAMGDQPAIDFALLPSKVQEQVVLRACEDPAAAREEIERLNPGITSSLVDAADDQVIAANADIVREKFAFSRIGARLQDAHQALGRAPIGQLEELSKGEAILQAFLKVDRLHTIRFEE